MAESKDQEQVEHEHHDQGGQQSQPEVDAAATEQASDAATSGQASDVPGSEHVSETAGSAHESDAVDSSSAADETVQESSASDDTAHQAVPAPDEQPPADPLAEIVAALDADEAAEEFKRPAAELKAIVEALIFASPDPLTPKALLKLLDNEPKEDVLAALDELKADYERPGGLQLVEVAGGFQIVTRPDLHEWVRRLFHERSTQKLSVAALETLAVIAYRQPITAIEITEIRGVNTSGVLNTLLERHLIKIVGRKQVVGRPFMYGTTKEFLVRFGLKDLGDLPKVEDMAESLGIESTLLVEQTPPEEQLPLSEPDSEQAGYDSEGGSVDADPDADDGPGESVH